VLHGSWLLHFTTYLSLLLNIRIRIQHDLPQPMGLHTGSLFLLQSGICTSLVAALCVDLPQNLHLSCATLAKHWIYCTSISCIPFLYGMYSKARIDFGQISAAGLLIARLKRTH
jgi:hypothetical protein